MQNLFDILRYPETLDDHALEVLATFGVRSALLPVEAAPEAGHAGDQEAARLRRAGISAFLSFGPSGGLPPGGVLETELQRLPELLSLPRAVALGPLRLPPGEPEPEYACERMLAQALELRRPVILQSETTGSPRDVRRILAMVRASRVSPESVLGVSLPPAGVPLFRESGHAVGMGLSRALPGRRLVETVQKLGSERLLLVGEGGDFLSLPKAVALLAEAKLPASVIRRLVWVNATRFFGVGDD